eukprot:487410-Hanusia_phi.AAC.1
MDIDRWCQHQKRQGCCPCGPQVDRWSSLHGPLLLTNPIATLRLLARIVISRRSRRTGAARYRA